jgi:uncharacterized membrane protein
MRFVALSIYALSIIMAIPVWDYLFYAVSESAFITFFIAAIVFKKICGDECLKKHFAYQSRTILVFLVYTIAATGGTFLLMRTLPGGFSREHPGMVVLYGLGSHLMKNTMAIWLLYRNIKGLVYLNKNKAI